MFHDDIRATDWILLDFRDVGAEQLQQSSLSQTGTCGEQYGKWKMITLSL